MIYPCRLPGANARDRDVTVPAGYVPKTEGYCRKGDRYWHWPDESWRWVEDAHSFLGAPCHNVQAVITPSTIWEVGCDLHDLSVD